jgi:hypothetical protein
LTILTSAGVLAALGIAAIVPYFLMLANRAPNLESVQLLTKSHMPNFASPTLILGLIVAAAIAVLVWRGLARLSEPVTLFALSFALTPIVLFNQQVVTGQLLQSAHYEIFISNYIVLTAAILLVSTLIGARAEADRSVVFSRGLIYLAIVAAAWGLVETASSTGRGSLAAIIRDGSIPALQFIQRDANLRSSAVVHATNFVTADFIPSVSTARPLWNAHSSSAGGITIDENRRLFYLYLYYSGHSDKDLLEELNRNTFEVVAAVFGSDRALPVLGEDVKRVSKQEIQTEVRSYGEFVRKFNETNAYNPVVSYIIVPTEAEPDFTNLDRWYIRDEGKVFGMFKIYGLTQKR